MADFRILKDDNTSRGNIEGTINEMVDSFFDGDENFKKLLTETAAHESHFGKLSKNVMQIDPIQVEELSKTKFAPQLGHMGVFPDK